MEKRTQDRLILIAGISVVTTGLINALRGGFELEGLLLGIAGLAVFLAMMLPVVLLFRRGKIGDSAAVWLMMGLLALFIGGIIVVDALNWFF